MKTTFTLLTALLLAAGIQARAEGESAKASVG